MAILRTFLYPEGNIQGQASYDSQNGSTFALVPINGDEPTDDSKFAGPNDGAADGDVLVAKSCVIAAGGDRTGDSIVVVARNTFPYTDPVLTEDDPDCVEPADCDLTATANYTASPGNVRLVVATSKPPFRTSSDNITFFVGREDWPAGPGEQGTLYVVDDGNCAKTVNYQVPGGGGSLPPGVVIDDFEPDASVGVNIYYDAATRTLKEYILPSTANLPSPISEQQRGRAEGELIATATVCEGTTQVKFFATLTPPYARLEATENSEACGYTPPAVLTITAQGFAPTVAGGAGSIRATPTGGTAPLTILLVGTGRSFPATAGQALTIPNVAPGSYPVRVSDSAIPAQVATITATVPVLAVSGCTDPNATNYDPNATEDDGSCEFAPIVVVPLLHFPEPQSLRFVLEATAVDQLRPDNTLFDNQRRPGLLQPGYCQKVARRDEVLVQWRSNFAAHTVRVVRCSNSQQVATFTPTKIVQGTGNTAVFGGYLTAHTSATRARLYFQAAVLPLPFLPGNRLVLSDIGIPALEGNYPILEVREDSQQGVPYVVLGLSYTAATASLRLDCTVETTYDVAPFDVWQVGLTFPTLAEDCYTVEVTATDPTLGSVVAVSEPFDLAAEHPGTVLIAYRNFDNAYGLNYSFGLLNRLRVVGRLQEVDPTTTKSILVESDTTTTLLAATARARYLLRTFQLPAYVHTKLTLAFAHDLVLVQNLEFVGEEAYESIETPGYSLKNGQITLTQRQWLGAGNGDDLGGIPLGEGLLTTTEGAIRY